MADFTEYVHCIYNYDLVSEDGTTYGGWTKLACRLCDHTVDLNPTIEDRDRKIHLMYPHLLEAHKISACEYCGDLVTKRGLTRHQKGMFCLAAQNRHRLMGQGKVNFSSWKIKDLEEHFSALVKDLTYGTNSSSEGNYGWLHRNSKSPRLEPTIQVSNELQARIASEANIILGKLKDIMGFSEENTCFRAGGWGVRTHIEKTIWIDKEYAHLWEMISQSWTHQHTELFFKYHDNPEDRDSILCLLELQNERD